MFESAELGHSIDKDVFREEVPKLRAALLDAQFELREKGQFPVIILISGGAGGDSMFVGRFCGKGEGGRGKGKTGHGTNACGRKKRLTVQPPFFLRPFLFTHQGASHV